LYHCSPLNENPILVEGFLDQGTVLGIFTRCTVQYILAKV